MGFGKSKSKEKKEPKPQIVVQPGSGSGVQGVTPETQQRVETTAPQTSLLTQNDEDEKLKKGLG